MAPISQSLFLLTPLAFSQCNVAYKRAVIKSLSKTSSAKIRLKISVTVSFLFFLLKLNGHINP